MQITNICAFSERDYGIECARRWWNIRKIRKNNNECMQINVLCMEKVHKIQPWIQMTLAVYDHHDHAIQSFMLPYTIQVQVNRIKWSAAWMSPFECEWLSISNPPYFFFYFGNERQKTLFNSIIIINAKEEKEIERER